MVMLGSGVGQKYNLGPVKPWVEAAAYWLGGRHNIKTIGGWRPSDPFPDHPSGHALDFMITSKSQGDALAQDAINNAGALGVKYIIWNHNVWNPQQGWHPYTSTSNPHTDHVHITFNDQPGTGVPGGAVPVDQPVSTVDDTCAWSFHLPIAGDTCLISKPQVRTLLAVLLIGGAAVVGLVGAVVLVAYGAKAGNLGSVPGGTMVTRVIPRPSKGTPTDKVPRL